MRNGTGQEAIWRSGDFTGPNRPMARATAQVFTVHTSKIGSHYYADYLFGQAFKPRELPNLKAIEYDRSTSTDAATCKITLYNTQPLPLGTAVTPDDDGNYQYDQPGFFCVDDQTEVLSGGGWKKHGDIAVGEAIYTLNAETGLAEWALVEEVFAKHYDGDLVRMESRSMSALVTPNHRWAVTNKARRKRDDSLVFKETQALARHDELPVARSGVDDVAERYSDAFVALMGWVITDGTYQKMDGSGRRVTINQSSTANPGKCQDLRLILKHLAAEFEQETSERLEGESIFFRFSGELARAVRAAAPDKKLTMHFARQLSCSQREILLAALVAGDGGLQGGGTRYLVTVDKEQAGVYQALISLCGLTSRCHERRLLTMPLPGYCYDTLTYYVNIKTVKHVKVADTHPTSEAYSGIVWCPRSKNGTFLARRNGRVYFTGNTFTRGLTTFTNRWHHVVNEWQGMLAPDRMIRTWEGYGFDATVCPERDTHMTPSGVWIIDDVAYSADGLITVNCRDGGRLLLDQIMFPPVVPVARYPLVFVPDHNVANPPRIVSTSGWLTPTYDTDSGLPYFGVDGAVYGHYPHEAFDTTYSNYWLSVGNADPRADYAYEYIQGKFATSKSIRYLKFTTWGGPYTCYISIFSGGKWLGAGKVPYNPNDIVSAPNGADIAFVTRTVVGLNQALTVDLGATYTGVTKVRLTFHNLYNSQLGPYPYRAGVRTFQVSATATTTVPGGTHVEGDFADYADIIKQLLAWSGYHWNKSTTSTLTWSDGTTHVVAAPTDDPVVGSGRIWGDIENAGVGAMANTSLDAAIWDKKPVMDGIAYVRDILGYIFWIDEGGAAVFRSPNIWKIGNFVGDAAPGPSYLAGASSLIVIDENETLLQLDVTLTSKDQRERVFIANTTGKIGATARGHTGPSGPFDANLRRVAGWTDQNFTLTKECQIMADLIALRQLFNYRTDKVTIPGLSAIQIDDQVRIIEGVTSEDFIQYVSGLRSAWDIETGEWTYQLDTHWLGETPFDNWAFNPTSLHADTLAFLRAGGWIV